MTKSKVGDQVTAHSQVGHVSGKMMKVYATDANCRPKRAMRALTIRSTKSRATRLNTSRCKRARRSLKLHDHTLLTTARDLAPKDASEQRDSRQNVDILGQFQASFEHFI